MRSWARARCLAGVPDGTAEPFPAAQELLVGEAAHGGVGVAQGVCLVEVVGEAGGVCLGNLIEGLLAESCGGERAAGLLDGGVGVDGPGGLGEPADELDPVGPAGECLADEHRGAWAQDAADLPCGGFEVGDVVDHGG